MNVLRLILGFFGVWFYRSFRPDVGSDDLLDPDAQRNIEATL